MYNKSKSNVQIDIFNYNAYDKSHVDDVVFLSPRLAQQQVSDIKKCILRHNLLNVTQMLFVALLDVGNV